MVSKLTSRKFLISAAAFLASFGLGMAGILPPEACGTLMALSAGIYAACEAYVDGQAARSTQTISTTTVSATANDKATVARVIAPEAEEAE